MNFLAKAVESFTGNSIPYTFKEKVVSNIEENPVGSKSIWNVYDGTSNKDGSAVTIFAFDLKSLQLAKYTPLARNAFKKSRGLSLLPGVLTVIDSIQNDNFIYIITERVQPLFNLLSQPLYRPANHDPASKDLLILGIYQVASALKYISVEGSSVHCNISRNAIFVTLSGEFKVSGFELLVSLKDKDFTVLSMAYQCPSFDSTPVPPEFETSGSNYFGSVKPSIAAKFDAYKFGAFACELLGAEEVPNKAGLAQNLVSSAVNTPKVMIPHLKRCLQASVATRYTIQQFLKYGEHSYFDTPLINLWKGIDKLALKNEDEKLDIFQSLDSIDNLPPGMLEFCILPELCSVFNTLSHNNNNKKSIILFQLLKHSKTLSDDSFSRLVKPVIFGAFTLPDRAIRMTLLNGLPDIVPRLSDSEVQNRIFMNLLQGFNDTNVTIREETIRAVIPIVSKISNRQLNNDLLRYLARLQADESSDIRTNVIVCLTKVAPFMNDNSRVAVLLTAFGKALKDQFVPARWNSLISFQNCLKYFSPEVCCSKALSALAPALLDKSSKVRVEAEKTLEAYLKKIRDAASKLPVDDEETIQAEDEQSRSLLNGFNTLSLSKVAVGSKNTLFGFGNTESSDSLAMKNNTNIPEEASAWNDEDDGGWDDEDDNLEDNANGTNSSTTASLGFGNTAAPAQTKPKSKLNLEEAESDTEDASAWDDEW